MEDTLKKNFVKGIDTQIQTGKITHIESKHSRY